MAICNPKSTPADPNARLSAAMVPKSEGEKKPTTEYRSVVEALLHIATTNRPNIAYGVSQVAKYCENPQPAHWNAIKRILAYLKGTYNPSLWLGGGNEGVIGYTDADYAGDLDGCKSTSGNIFFYKGDPIAWSSSKQTCVALSTTESEFIEATKAAQTAIWLGLMETELEQTTTARDEPKPRPVTIFCDNQSAIRLVKNAESINERDTLTSGTISSGTTKQIDMQYVESCNQLADIFTKPLPLPVFTEMRERIGVGTLPKN